MNFLTNIPINNLDVHIFYSKDNQIIYSNAYQDSIQSLALNSPVIMVINPKSLTPEESEAFLSNRFFWFTYEKKSTYQTEFDDAIQSVSNMKYLLFENLINLIFIFFNLLLSIILLTVFVIKKKTQRVPIIDRLIFSFISLIIISLFFPTNLYSYAFVVFLHLYFILKDIYRRRNEGEATNCIDKI